LLRVVAVVRGVDQAGDDLIFVEPDPARIRPGRGAHVHPDPACLALAERRRAFGRALRVTGVVDTGPLAAMLASARDTRRGANPARQQGRTTDMSTR
jgi:predicted RNA-binding protein YlxR (DUF448 family)